MGESITCAKDNFDCFSVGLNKEEEFIQPRAQGEGRGMINGICFCEAERVVDAHQTHFATTKTKMQYSSCLDSGLKEPKQNLASDVSLLVVPMDLHMELLESLRGWR